MATLENQSLVVAMSRRMRLDAEQQLEREIDPTRYITVFGASTEQLPNELLLAVFSHLPLEMIRRCRRVCKRWRQALDGMVPCEAHVRDMHMGLGYGLATPSFLDFAASYRRTWLDILRRALHMQHRQMLIRKAERNGYPRSLALCVDSTFLNSLLNDTFDQIAAVASSDRFLRTYKAPPAKRRNSM